MYLFQRPKVPSSLFNCALFTLFTLYLLDYSTVPFSLCTLCLLDCLFVPFPCSTALYLFQDTVTFHYSLGTFLIAGLHLLDCIQLCLFHCSLFTFFNIQLSLFQCSTVLYLPDDSTLPSLTFHCTFLTHSTALYLLDWRAIEDFRQSGLELGDIVVDQALFTIEVFGPNQAD